MDGLFRGGLFVLANGGLIGAVSACRRSRTSAHPPPLSRPWPVGPQKEGTQPEAGWLSSQAVAAILLVAARISISGRMSSASIGPPGSWPCRPSTPRLSRLPQPPSRRIVPPWVFGPPRRGADPLLWLRRAARARGSACQRRQGKFPLTPLSARAISSAAFPQQALSPSPDRYSVCHACLKEEPRRPLRAHRTRGLRRLARTGVVRHTPASGVNGSPRKGCRMVTVPPNRSSPSRSAS